MAESKFTPGPWSIVPYGDGSSLVIHSDEDNRVCFMATASSDRPSSHASIRANARLIAAAPDLLEALQAITLSADNLLRLVDELRERGEVDHWQSIQCADLAADLNTANAALSRALSTEEKKYV